MKKIGLCLSGGGLRGAAHIGVLQALNDLGIFPSHISGSSIGALVGALYCSGHSAGAILKLSENHSFRQLFKINWINKGLTEHAYLQSFLNDNIAAQTFEELDIPLYAGLSNIDSGEFEIHSSGALIPAIKATCAIPIIFKPEEIDGQQYVDGGLMNNLPIEPLQAVCDVVIGIGVCKHEFDSPASGIREIGVRSFHIAIWNTMAHRMKQCDLAIDVVKAADYGLFDFDGIHELYQVGYDTTMAYKRQLDAFL